MAPPPAGSASSSSSREGYRSVNASHRYLKHAGPSRGEPEPQQKRSKYHVTRHRRRPTIMAHTDNSDLDPAWQDLDRKQQSWSRNYKPLLRMLVIYNLFSSPSIRRMEESTVFSTKTTYANFPVPWASQLLVEPT
ncbi:hypothetical protein LB505_006286 [Fusarium chuoi]|nr:hypothetical protein LB505_006286 [Fusarium chuoi]